MIFGHPLTIANRSSGGNCPAVDQQMASFRLPDGDNSSVFVNTRRYPSGKIRPEKQALHEKYGPTAQNLSPQKGSRSGEGYPSPCCSSTPMHRFLQNGAFSRPCRSPGAGRALTSWLGEDLRGSVLVQVFIPGIGWKSSVSSHVPHVQSQQEQRG